MIDRRNDERYFLLHFLKYLNAIDYEKAELIKLRSGAITGVEKYAFKPSIIKDEHLFKVTLGDRHYTTAVFVTEEFKQMLENSNLKGFEFIEVWDSNE
jgi:hypothetical protein